MDDPSFIIRALDRIARRIEIPYQHWLSGGHVDQGLSYCYACAAKHVERGEAESVDGGWPQDNDGICHCEDCGRLLEYTLTDYGVEEEFAHFRRYRLRGKLTPTVAYYLARFLEHYPQHPEVLAILPSAERAVARLRTMENRANG